MESLSISKPHTQEVDLKQQFDPFVVSLHDQIRKDRPDINWEGFFGKHIYIPDIVVVNIFSCLNPRSLSACCLVNSLWNAVADQPGFWDRFAPKDTFDKKQWIQYYGDTGEVPPLPHAAIGVAHEPCPFWKGKKVHETHALFLMPSKVGETALTINNLDKVAASPKTGHPASFSQSRGVAFAQHGDTPVPGPYWVSITTDLVPGSINLTTDVEKIDSVHQDFMRPYSRYRKGKALELAACIFSRYARTGEYLFSADTQKQVHMRTLYTGKSTYCLENVVSGLALKLGPFHPMKQQRTLQGDSDIGLELNVSGGDRQGLMLVREFKTPLPKKSLNPSSRVLMKESELPAPLSGVFSKTEWEQYVGKISQELMVPSDLEQLKESPCVFWSDETIGQTHHIFWVPPDVDGERLTLVKLGEKIKQKRGGINSVIGVFSNANFSPSIVRQIGDRPLPGGVWILMTKDLIPGSQGKSLKEMEQILKKYPGYQMPTAADLALGILTASCQPDARAGAFKHGAYSWTKTWFSEKVVTTTGSKKPKRQETVFEGYVAVSGYGSFQKHVDFQLYGEGASNVGLVGVRIIPAYNA